MISQNLQNLIERYRLQKSDFDKQRNRPLRIAFVGGSGVGKSSILNLLVGKEISRVSPRRPTTQTPILFIPEGIVLEAGELGNYNVEVEHYLPSQIDFKISLLDLPDLDSYQLQNREITSAFLEFSDVICFVFSEGKYGDKILLDFIEKAYALHKEIFFILNKTENLEEEKKNEIQEYFYKILRQNNIKIEELTFLPFSTLKDKEKYREALLKKLSDYAQREIKIREKEVEALKSEVLDLLKKEEENLDNKLSSTKEEKNFVQKEFEKLKSEIVSYIYGFLKQDKILPYFQTYLYSLYYPYPASPFLFLVFYVGVLVKKIFVFLQEVFYKLMNLFSKIPFAVSIL
jgi:tRNA U34 5-carboxymethylaminomethyl modifying GTPase MnmE/TrmE